MSKNKVIIDKKLKQKLKGYSFISDTFDWSPDLTDVPEEYIPVFKIKYPSNADVDIIKSYYMEALVDSNDNKKLSSKDKKREQLKMKEKEDVLQDMTRKSITGWVNFIDISTEKEVEFITDDEGFLKQELYRRLPYIMQVSMLNAILEVIGII